VSARNDSIEITILMPCLNEAETIEACIRKANRYLEGNSMVGEVLIADNGSTDGSQNIAHSLGARVITVNERGYGAALIGGINAARGRFIIMGDADDSYDFSALEPFEDALRSGADLVMGNRFKGGIAPGAMPFLHRYVGNPVLSFLGRLFFRIRVGDFHCGLRCFRADAIRSLGLKATGMEFASEMVVKSALAGLVIREAPTTLTKDGRSRQSHLRTWRDGWRHLKFLLMYSPRWLFFVPGAVCLAFGLIAGTRLFSSPMNIHNIVFQSNTFVAACFAVLIGTQLLTFGALARQYAAMSGFLPWSKAAKTLDRFVSTERLALIASAIMAMGAVLFLYSFWKWAQVSFGELTNPIVAHTVMVGLTAFAVGIQLFFAAFLFGLLRIPRSK
jgi:glycosyltransferase involved in cell wall biosynthesis